MTKRTILLIEDEEAISEPLAAALGREGFEALVAGTAARGLELFASRTRLATLPESTVVSATTSDSSSDVARLSTFSARGTARAITTAARR